MTSDAVKYEITLENERRLRMRTWEPADDATADRVHARPPTWSDVAFTPTSRLLVRMLHPSGKSWAVPIAVVLVLIYVAVAFALRQSEPSSDAMALVTTLGIALFLWNAVKFAIAAVVMVRSARRGGAVRRSVRHVVGDEMIDSARGGIALGRCLGGDGAHQGGEASSGHRGVAGQNLSKVRGSKYPTALDRHDQQTEIRGSGESTTLLGRAVGQ